MLITVESGLASKQEAHVLLKENINVLGFAKWGWVKKWLVYGFGQTAEPGDAPSLHNNHFHLHKQCPIGNAFCYSGGIVVALSLCVHSDIMHKYLQVH